MVKPIVKVVTANTSERPTTCHGSENCQIGIDNFEQISQLKKILAKKKGPKDPFYYALKRVNTSLR